MYHITTSDGYQIKVNGEVYAINYNGNETITDADGFYRWLLQWGLQNSGEIKVQFYGLFTAMYSPLI